MYVIGMPWPRSFYDTLVVAPLPGFTITVHLLLGGNMKTHEHRFVGFHRFGKVSSLFLITNLIYVTPHLTRLYRTTIPTHFQTKPGTLHDKQTTHRTMSRAILLLNIHSWSSTPVRFGSSKQTLGVLPMLPSPSTLCRLSSSGSTQS